MHEGGQVSHLGRDVLGAQLRLDVRVIQLADEGVRPCLAGVDGHMHVVLPVPLPPLLQGGVFSGLAFGVHSEGTRHAQSTQRTKQRAETAYMTDIRLEHLGSRQ